MKKLLVIEPIKVSSGNIFISKKQADVRSHNLKHVKDNQYTVVGDVMFKSGEEIGVDEVPKHWIADGLVEVEKRRGKRGN